MHHGHAHGASCGLVFDGGLGIRGKASMKEERPKMGVEEPSSDYSCSNSIVAAIHMAFVMASCMASIEFRLNRRVVLRVGSCTCLLPLRRRCLWICYDSWHVSMVDVIQGKPQTHYMTPTKPSQEADEIR